MRHTCTSDFLTAILALLILAGTGCSTVSSVEGAPPDQGTSFSIPEACQPVREALKLALESLHFKVKTQEDTGKYDREIIAAKALSPFSWGELVRVSLREEDAVNTTLVVTTKRRVATNITAKGDWSQEIYEAVIRELDDVEP